MCVSPRCLSRAIAAISPHVAALGVSPRGVRQTSRSSCVKPPLETDSYVESSLSCLPFNTMSSSFHVPSSKNLEPRQRSEGVPDALHSGECVVSPSHPSSGFPVFNVILPSDANSMSEIKLSRLACFGASHSNSDSSPTQSSCASTSSFDLRYRAVLDSESHSPLCLPPQLRLHSVTLGPQKETPAYSDDSMSEASSSYSSSSSYPPSTESYACNAPLKCSGNNARTPWEANLTEGKSKACFRLNLRQETLKSGPTDPPCHNDSAREQQQSGGGSLNLYRPRKRGMSYGDSSKQETLPNVVIDKFSLTGQRSNESRQVPILKLGEMRRPILESPRFEAIQIHSEDNQPSVVDSDTAIRDYCRHFLTSKSVSDSPNDAHSEDVNDLDPSELKARLLRRFRDVCSEVTPGARLYISGLSVARNEQLLSRLGITHIINIAGGTYRYLCSTAFYYLMLFIRDQRGASEEFEAILFYILDYINSILKNVSHRVLIHCREGVSRSASVATAYIMWKAKLRFRDALDVVRSIRECCNPNIGFTVSLLRFEKLIFQTRTPVDVIFEKKRRLVSQKTLHNFVATQSILPPYVIPRRLHYRLTDVDANACLSEPFYSLSSALRGTSPPSDVGSKPVYQRRLLRLTIHDALAPFVVAVGVSMFDEAFSTWVPEITGGLDPRFCYILRDDFHFYLWKGSREVHSELTEAVFFSEYMASIILFEKDLAPEGWTFTIIRDGEEPDVFWNLLNGDVDAKSDVLVEGYRVVKQRAELDESQLSLFEAAELYNFEEYRHRSTSLYSENSSMKEYTSLHHPFLSSPYSSPPSRDVVSPRNKISETGKENDFWSLSSAKDKSHRDSRCYSMSTASPERGGSKEVIASNASEYNTDDSVTQITSGLQPWCASRVDTTSSKAREVGDSRLRAHFTFQNQEEATNKSPRITFGLGSMHFQMSTPSIAEVSAPEVSTWRRKTGNGLSSPSDEFIDNKMDGQSDIKTIRPMCFSWRLQANNEKVNGISDQGTYSCASKEKPERNGGRDLKVNSCEWDRRRSTEHVFVQNRHESPETSWNSSSSEELQGDRAAPCEEYMGTVRYVEHGVELEPIIPYLYRWPRLHQPIDVFNDTDLEGCDLCIIVQYSASCLMRRFFREQQKAVRKGISPETDRVPSQPLFVESPKTRLSSDGVNLGHSDHSTALNDLPNGCFPEDASLKENSSWCSDASPYREKQATVLWIWQGIHWEKMSERGETKDHIVNQFKRYHGLSLNDQDVKVYFETEGQESENFLTMLWLC